MKPEEKYRRVKEANLARGELEADSPSLQLHVRKQYRLVKAHMADNNGVLDSDFAVQAWYRVQAALDFEEILQRTVKRGVAASGVLGP